MEPEGSLPRSKGPISGTYPEPDASNPHLPPYFPKIHSASCPGRFTSRERAPGTHWIGGCVGPTAGLTTVSKRKIPSPRRDSNLDHPRW